ncbi:MAG: hypothetical protein M1381_11795 [Deltaproteobacteria bacterium]|nr:hypothetical protein [Deltaproteobacteria bacterium]
MARISKRNLINKQIQVLKCYYWNKDTKGKIKATAQVAHISKNTVKKWLKLLPRYVHGITNIRSSFDPHDRRRGVFFYETSLLDSELDIELYKILSGYYIQWDKVVDLNNAINTNFKEYLNDDKLKQELINKNLDPDYIAFLIFQFYSVAQPDKSINADQRLYGYKTLWGIFTYSDHPVGVHRRGKSVRTHLLKDFILNLNHYLADNKLRYGYAQKIIINLEFDILNYLPDWLRKKDKSHSKQRFKHYWESAIRDHLSLKKPWIGLGMYILFKKTHIIHRQGGFTFDEIGQLYRTFEQSYKKFITKDAERYFIKAFVNESIYSSVLLADNMHDHMLADYTGLRKDIVCLELIIVLLKRAIQLQVHT